MAAISQQPVIVNSSLTHTEFLKHLKQQQHLKLKFTDSTVTNSTIFPRSGVAFILMPLQNAVIKRAPNQNSQLNVQVVQWIDKMAQVHKNFYILLMAPLHGKQEMEVLSQIQLRYIDRCVNVIPCHNATEAVQIMLDIAKMSGRTEPAAALLRGRLASQMERKTDPVFVLKQIGLTDHDAQVLQDSFGSIHKVVTATDQALGDTCLEKASIVKVKSFFKKDQSL